MGARTAVLIAVIGGIGVVGCAIGEDDAPDESERVDAALHLMFDVEDGADVERGELTISRCDGEQLTSRVADVSVWAHHQLVPSHLEDHGLFLEEYHPVPAGCYDVELVMYDRNDERTRCTAALGRGIEVESGETGEAVLFSRCGEDIELPTVEMVEFEPTSHTGCGDDVDVCATVYGGARLIDTYWAHDDGPPLRGDIEEGPQFDRGDRRVHCTRWSPLETGEIVGVVQAYPKRAETMGGGETVLFAARHRVRFSLFAECLQTTGNGATTAVASAAVCPADKQLPVSVKQFGQPPN